MADRYVQWGCCANECDTGSEAKSIKCPTCAKCYHYACISLAKSPNKKAFWKCPSCLSKTPKLGRDDSTPVRNVSTTRGPKRPATEPPLLESPSPKSKDYDELRSIIREVIKDELSEMSAKFNNTIITTISKELAPIKKEIADIVESMSFMNRKFEDIAKAYELFNETITKLESENADLKITVDDLKDRLANLEQQSRSNNIELQCVPENKNENVYNIVTQLARVVNCEISERDVLHCTRIAKANQSSSRPRSILLQLASPRIRDRLLAATIKYNQANPQEKLNCSHLGYAGPKSPVFVAEHLSPTNRALHAATRIKAKEKNYRYVWVRNGKIFVRKTDGAEYIQIRNKSSLDKVV